MTRSNTLFHGLVTSSLVALTLMVLPAIGAGKAYAQRTAGSVFANPTASTLTWYGPVGLTREQTAIFSYSNFAPDTTTPVLVEWAFSDALTGELIIGNFGKPGQLGSMSGIDWKLDGARALEGRSDNRRPVVGWLRITYADPDSARRAVDLGTIEIIDSETGKTEVFVEANPTAPGDKYILRMD